MQGDFVGRGIVQSNFDEKPAVVDCAGDALEHKCKVWGKVRVDDSHLARNVGIRQRATASGVGDYVPVYRHSVGGTERLRGKLCSRGLKLPVELLDLLQWRWLGATPATTARCDAVSLPWQ